LILKNRTAYTKAHESAPWYCYFRRIRFKGGLCGIISPVLSNSYLPYLDLGDVFTIAQLESRGYSGELLAPDALDMMIEVGELDREARKFFIDKILEKPHDTND